MQLSFTEWKVGEVSPGTVEVPVRVLKVEASPQLRSSLSAHKDGVYQVRFSPDGQSLATAGPGGVVALWNVASRERRVELERMGQVYGLAFSPDGKSLLVPCFEPVDAAGKPLEMADRANMKGLRGGVRICEVSSGKLLGWLRRDPPRGVSSVCVSADGKTVALREHSFEGKEGRTPANTALWDLSTRKLVRELSGNESQLVDLSPDGTTLIRSGETSVLWDVAANKERETLTQKGEHLGQARFSRDGKTVAGLLYGREGLRITLWDSASGKRLKQINPGEGVNVRALVFSPDGSKLAVAEAVRSRGVEPCDVCLWDVATGQKVLTLRGHVNDVTALDFHPDGKWLASGGSDGAVRLWEVAAEASARR